MSDVDSRVMAKHRLMRAINRFKRAEVGLNPFALAMPDEFKTDNAVESYRAYYHSKASFAKWTRRKPPTWWNPK